MAYSAPRMSAQAISPRAMSAMPSGVESDRVVSLGVAQLEEEVERGLVDRAVHRRRGEQAGATKTRVADRLAVGPGHRPTSAPSPKPMPSR